MKRHDLMTTFRGNGVTICDRTRTINGDYAEIAWISNTGEINIYERNLPNKLKTDVTEEIQEYINSQRFSHVVEMKKQEFTANAKVNFFTTDDFQISILHHLSEYFKSNDLQVGETSVTPNQITLYHPKVFDSSLKKITTSFKVFGSALSFPLSIDDDWVRIQCGVDGSPNYIFGQEGLKEFYEAGAGIYSRDQNGKPKESLEYWQEWYAKERAERIGVSQNINEIKAILNDKKFKFPRPKL